MMGVVSKERQVPRRAADVSIGCAGRIGPDYPAINAKLQPIATHLHHFTSKSATFPASIV